MFVIPNSAVYIAKQVRPIPSKAVVNTERETITIAFWEEIIGDYGAKHRSSSYFATGYSVVSGNLAIRFPSTHSLQRSDALVSRWCQILRSTAH